MRVYRIPPIHDDVVYPIHFRLGFGESQLSRHRRRRGRPSGMFLKKNPEQRPGKRRRVLLVGGDSPNRDSISTLLNTMRWTCTAVSVQDGVLAAIERELFDVILLDLDHVGADAERILLRIKEIRPSLSERIVAISSERVDPQALELIERHGLPHLFQEHLLSQLWTTLEDLLAPRELGKAAAGNIPMARLLFDSFRMPSPSGVRSAHTAGRHFTYEHNHTTIDVFLDCSAGSDRISLVGQVLEGAKAKGKNESLPVVLIGGSGTVARTTTNHLGEFNLECEFTESVSLEIRLGERSWVTIPLGQMDWVKKQIPNRAIAT
jgi:CheY-like chemotaxis protein